MFNVVFEKHKKVLIPFLMAGVPTLEDTELLADALIEEGARIIEIGVPFSDPGADGPVLQRASEIALQSDVTLEKVLKTIHRIKTKNPEVLIVLFTYLNPILAIGIERYVEMAVEAGVSATLTVDLPVEEADEYLGAHNRGGLGTVFLASPTTSAERLPSIKEASSAFLYYVSRTGVTGSQKTSARNLDVEAGKLRRGMALPTCIGFGISSPEDVRTVGKHFEGVIIGSAYMKIIMESGDREERLFRIKAFTRDCVQALE